MIDDEKSMMSKDGRSYDRRKNGSLGNSAARDRMPLRSRGSSQERSNSNTGKKIY
jgi:hypothetical protein